MNQGQWSAVDSYYEGMFLAPDAALEGALADSAAAGLPAIAVSPLQGQLLHLIARAIGARRILEIGMLGGYSTIWLARAMPAEGRLVSLELDPGYARVARANLDRAGVGERCEIRVGPAQESLRQLTAERAAPFDLVFIDADKQSYATYLEWSVRLSRPGTLIIADNMVREGEVVDAASADAMVQGVRRFNEALVREPRLRATAVQTVGVKGYDGFVMAIVGG